MELLEYFDEKNENLIGVEERQVIHNKGLWHREVAVWVVNDKNEVLLQRRSAKKKQGANKISITAGHIDVDEKPECAAVRELSEEVGIFVQTSDLIFLDIYRNERVDNKCFSYTYLVKTDKKIEDMCIQEDEVSEVMYSSIENLEDRIKNGDEELSFSKKTYTKQILEQIKKRIG